MFQKSDAQVQYQMRNHNLINASRNTAGSHCIMTITEKTETEHSTNNSRIENNPSYLDGQNPAIDQAF